MGEFEQDSWSLSKGTWKTQWISTQMFLLYLFLCPKIYLPKKKSKDEIWDFTLKGQK